MHNSLSKTPNQPCLGHSAGQPDNSKSSYKMKALIIKSIIAVLAIVALVMLIGDMPNANLFIVSMTKIAGIALLLAAARVWEKNVPEENI